MEYKSQSSNGDMDSVLEECLENILSALKPSQNDNANRVAAISELETAMRSTVISEDIVNPYGSYLSNLHSKSSDLDVSIDGLKSYLCSSHDAKGNALRIVKDALERTGIARNVVFVPHARVPVLSYESKVHNISCDVTIDNHIAQIKSDVFKKINDIDSRFRDLVLLVKEWAKGQQINDPKSGTLNSYSLTLLVIFHLQTCDPPILPPFSMIYKGNISADIQAQINRGGDYLNLLSSVKETCDRNLAQYYISRAYGSRNQSSLSQLFLSFFNKFSTIDLLARNNIICPYNGSIKNKILRGGSLNIEDPFNQETNAAGVWPEKSYKISDAFKVTNDKLSSVRVLSDHNSLLGLLAGPDVYSQLVRSASIRNLSNGH